MQATQHVFLRKVVSLICSGKPCFISQQLHRLGPTKCREEMPHLGRSWPPLARGKGSTEAPGTSPAGPWSPGHRRASLEQRQWGRHLLFIAKGPAQGERKLRRREKRQHRASLRVIIPDTWLCSPPSGSLLIPIKNPLPEACKMPALYGIK